MEDRTENTQQPRKRFPLELTVIVSILVIAGLLAIGHFVFAPPPGPRFSKSVEGQLAQTVELELEQQGIPGAVVGVWVPGKGTWVQTEGVARLESGKSMSADDKFRIGSITKSFVATVVLQLVDEGRVKLDDPVSAYLPDVAGTSDITVRQLLNHTSGLYDFLDNPDFTKAANAEPGRHREPRELLAYALSHEPYFAPGQGWHYSNTNYVLLGMLIEKVTGKKLSTEIDRRILQPLHLRNTSFPDGPTIQGSHADGYADLNGDGAPENITGMNPSLGWASSAMVSNLEDLRVWARALADGTLISPAMQRERTQWVATSPQSDYRKYGLGIEYIGGLIGHEGVAFGYNCSMYYFPANGATIVVLLNETPQGYESANQVLFGIARVLFPEKVPVVY